MWSAKVKAIFLKCSVLPNCRLVIVGGGFVASIDSYDKFYIKLLFDRSIYRPMCTRMGKSFLANVAFL